MSQRRHAVESTAGRRRSGPTPPRYWPSSLPGPARRSSAMGCPMPNPIGPGLQRPSRQARRARRTALIGAPIRYQGRLPRLTFTKRENRIPDEAPRKLRIRRLSARGQTCTPMLDTLCGPNVRWRSFSNRSRIDSHGLAKSAKNQPNQRQLMFSVERPFRRDLPGHLRSIAPLNSRSKRLTVPPLLAVSCPSLTDPQFPSRGHSLSYGFATTTAHFLLFCRVPRSTPLRVPMSPLSFRLAVRRYFGGRSIWQFSGGTASFAGISASIFQPYPDPSSSCLTPCCPALTKLRT